MRRSALGLAIVSAVLVSGAAWSQEGGGGGGGSWTYGNMLGAGRSAIDGQFGWPGISVGYLTGLSDRFDIGAHFTFNYAIEGDTSFFGNGGLAPGVKLAGDFKLRVARTGKADILLVFTPAILGYFKDQFSLFGFTLPVPELVFGLPITNVLLVHFGMRIPWTIGVLSGGGTSNFSMLIPIQFGAGMEFVIDPRLSFTFNFKVGPLIADVNGNTNTDVAFDALFGVTYRL